MNETEPCQVWSIDPPLKIAEVYLEFDYTGLPVLFFMDSPQGVERYHPWSLPANWQLRAPANSGTTGELLLAWRDIEEIIRRLSDWSRRNEACGQETQNEEFGGCE
jgi:hypothetical protein